MPEIYSISALAGILERDRRTVAKLLSDIPPDGHDAQGNPRWKISTAVRALTMRSLVGGSAVIDEIEQAGADVQYLLERLRAAGGADAARKLLRAGLGKAVGRLDRALEAEQQSRLPAEQQLLGLVRNQIVGAVVGEVLDLAEWDLSLDGPLPPS